MKRRIIFTLALLLISSEGFSQSKNETDSGQKLRQFYSGKFGFYQPGEGLNNGIILGLDGITEFIHYNFFLSGALDIYPKQSIDIFQQPKPEIRQQQIVLLPLHINIGYKLFEASDAETRGYIGLGGGYYFYFYSIEYQSSGGLLSSVSTQLDSKTDGNVFGTLFARILIGKIFVEPRYYLASKSEDNISTYKYTVNPTGFAITIGFQQ